MLVPFFSYFGTILSASKVNLYVRRQIFDLWNKLKYMTWEVMEIKSYFMTVHLMNSF